MIDIASKTATTVQPALPSVNNSNLTWMPDSSYLVFGSNRAESWDIYSVNVDSSAGAEALLVKEFDQFPESWSRDGRILLYREMHPTTSYDIWTMSLDETDPNPFVTSPGNDRFAQFSPEGNWVAYTSDASGRDQVFVCSFPDCEDVQRTVANGAEPAWSPDGSTIYFRNGNQMLAVDVLEKATMTLGVPRPLFQGQYRSPETYLDSYDIHPDGDRFLMITNTSTDEIRIVQNWFEELKERVPVP